MNASTGLRLPPVDFFRKPFIEPLGVLAFWAAHLEHAVIEFAASTHMLEDGPTAADLDPSTVARAAKNLENWNRGYLDGRLGALPDEWRGEVRAIIDRIEAVREDRNRLLHDMIDLGVEEASAGGYVVVPLKAGFPRKAPLRGLQLEPISPAIVAAVAMEAYEACKDLEMVTNAVLKIGHVLPEGP